MALKTQEVKHMILSQSMPELNATVAKLLEDGWKLLDCRLQFADYHNQVYSVFYVFVRER